MSIDVVTSKPPECAYLKTLTNAKNDVQSAINGSLGLPRDELDI